MPPKRVRESTASQSQSSAKRRKVAHEPKVTSKVHWNNDLTWKLVGGITGNVDIRVGLFLGPESHPLFPNHPRGTKTHWFMELAEIVFRDHPRYGPAYHADECDQKKWATKVKKRCEKLILEARKHIHEMERAGPGITSLDEIDFERETPFTTLARKVLAECPWYFQVKAIHDEARGGPPGGFQVGNSRTPLEETVLSQPHGSVSKSPQVREEDTDEGDDSEESKEDNTAEGGQSDHEDQADESEEDEEDNDENTRAMATLFYRYKAAEQRRRQVLEAEIDELTLEITRVKAKAEIKIVRERAKLMLYKTRVQHEAQRMRYRERITALQAGFIVPPYQPRPGGAVPPALEIPEPNAAY